MAEGRDPRVGSLLDGRYRIVAPVAVGGMGAVYRAERVQLGRPVAVKFLLSPLANKREFLRRFEVEARAMSRLSHPNCVSIIDFGVVDAPYLVMDFISGRTLEMILQRGRLSITRALGIGRQILAGLAHAHKQEVLHCDIKPANVVVTEDLTGTGDFVRLLDFGLAKLRDAGISSHSGEEKFAVGTPSYMPPEQLRGEPILPSSDVYSTGVLLFELLSGRKPFVADDPLELVRMHLEQPPPHLAELAPEAGFSTEIDGVLYRAMVKSPGERYQTAIEFASALENTPEARRRRGAPETAPQRGPPPLPRPPETSDRRDRAPHRARTRALLLLALFSAVAAAVYHYGYLDRWIGPGARRPGHATPSTKTPRRAVESGATATNRLAGIDAGAAPDASAGGTADAAPDASAGGTADAAPDAGAEVADAEGAGAEGGGGTEPDAGAEGGSGTKPDASDGQTPAIDRQPRPHATAGPTAERWTMERVKALVQAGQPHQAIQGLRQLRPTHRKSANLHYWFGRAYFDKHFYSDGIAAYREAIRLNPRFRRHRALIEDLVALVGHRKVHYKAASMIRREIGRAALPSLRNVARRHPKDNVRVLAAQLIVQISAR
jgi:serine/threonine-protein kinase